MPGGTARQATRALPCARATCPPPRLLQVRVQHVEEEVGVLKVGVRIRRAAALLQKGLVVALVR
eukprot:3707636-Prymnesium_polylepis.1